ncbi:MAG TPA: SDR family NAD(P)-dependent oxidoreductase [Euzebya sp.]|nr:SDR family NAD(P)-dependent oxidoreductase [Euzebya sp.]
MAGALEGRRILVTGASSGIGEATAVACAQAGAVVAGLARRTLRLEALQAAHGIHPVVGDIGDTDAVPEMIGRAVGLLGGLDAVVNSAGLSRPGLVADADPADWKAMFDINVLGLLAVTQAAIPHLLRAGMGSSIINISSMSGRRVLAPTAGTYAGTKFAVHAISEGLRQELQSKGVRVTTIAPGFVATALFDGQDETGPGGQYRRMLRTVGMAPADVAAAVVHALSAPASVTTVEVALAPTQQDDAGYSAAIEGD